MRGASRQEWGTIANALFADAFTDSWWYDLCWRVNVLTTCIYRDLLIPNWIFYIVLVCHGRDLENEQQVSSYFMGIQMNPGQPRA
jgi:hypothetical protein